MDEYIKREMALEAIDEYFRTTNPDGDEQIGVLKSRRIIRTLPPADVDTVWHGRWIDKPLIKSFKHTNIPVVECSECGIDFCDIINNHYFMYRFCPNCGARMDGDK